MTPSTRTARPCSALLLLVAEHIHDLRRIRDRLDGPPGDDSMSLIHDAEDFLTYDTDPDANFHVGFLTGAAAALELSIEQLLALIPAP